MVEGLYISGVKYESVVDGEGLRSVIFISGCTHNCKGCHSPRTHSFTYGKEATDELIDEMKYEIYRRKDVLSGITLSGGDPFCSPSKVAELIRQLGVESWNIWAYTGFLLEDMLKDESCLTLLPYVNVLVDGPFEEDERDIRLKFKGSTNQRIIDVQATLESGEIIEHQL